MPRKKMPDNSSKAPYITSAEIDFINNLGKHAEEIRINRFDLLARYKRACEKRQNWERIDPSVSMAYLDQLTRD